MYPATWAVPSYVSSVRWLGGTVRLDGHTIDLPGPIVLTTRSAPPSSGRRNASGFPLEVGESDALPEGNRSLRPHGPLALSSGALSLDSEVARETAMQRRPVNRDPS